MIEVKEKYDRAESRILSPDYERAEEPKNVHGDLFGYCLFLF